MNMLSLSLESCLAYSKCSKMLVNINIIMTTSQILGNGPIKAELGGIMFSYTLASIRETAKVSNF